MPNDDPLLPEVESALGLTIKGSLGEFSVSHGGNTSVRVHYLQSHISLALHGDHGEKLLRSLVPVREAFETRRLDFEQIMQRDIDDARVSTELIPYLLEAKQTGLVKLFPPIIVVVVPTDRHGLPAEYYAKVSQIPPTAGEKLPRHILRSGSIGEEVFEIRQVEWNGKRLDHDYAELRLNPDRVKLVIVDGQHRAMGLLALYRNIKGWPEGTRSVQPYYKIWAQSHIDTFDLAEVKLPVMFCVFPELDGTSLGAPTVYSACRSIFLALNKNAKKVTRARNFLLDDRDLISALLRSLLTHIKALDANSPYRLRLWGIELDADEDKTVVRSPIAITGVSQLYGLIERLMLGKRPSDGIGAARGNLWLRKMSVCFARLGVEDQIPIQVRDDARRESCDQDTLQLLARAFDVRYGRLLLQGLARFGPYDASHSAALDLYNRLSTGAQAEFYRSLFFDGEGQGRVFVEFRNGLDRLQKDGIGGAEWRDLAREFASREEEVGRQVESFRLERAKLLLNAVPKLEELLQGTNGLADAIDSLYDTCFNTAAFQNAIFLTFFNTIEQVDANRSKPPAAGTPLGDAEVLALFSEYLEHLDRFFRPRSLEALRSLLFVFVGELRDDGVVKATTLRGILIPNELKPDEWPKFRAILVELWKTRNNECNEVLSELRHQTRREALDHYVKRRIKQVCMEERILETELPAETRTAIQLDCAGHISSGLSALGRKVSPEALVKRWLKGLREGGDPSEDGED